MKAALHHSFGGTDVLEVVDVADPVPGRREVLVAEAQRRLEAGDVLGKVIIVP